MINSKKKKKSTNIDFERLFQVWNDFERLLIRISFDERRHFIYTTLHTGHTTGIGIDTCCQKMKINLRGKQNGDG